MNMWCVVCFLSHKMYHIYICIHDTHTFCVCILWYTFFVYIYVCVVWYTFCVYIYVHKHFVYMLLCDIHCFVVYILCIHICMCCVVYILCIYIHMCCVAYILCIYTCTQNIHIYIHKMYTTFIYVFMSRIYFVHTRIPHQKLLGDGLSTPITPFS